MPASVRVFFDREVKPHVPDAWLDTTKRDPKDGRVGLIGYEMAVLVERCAAALTPALVAELQTALPR